MDEKIIKKNAVPVIAAMITALAFSFTGLPMDGNTSVEKISDLFGGNASWNFLFYKWKLGFSVWRKETDPDLSRMFYRILYYL